MPDYTKNTDAWNNKAPKKKNPVGPLGNGLAENARKKLKNRDSDLKRKMKEQGI